MKVQKLLQSILTPLSLMMEKINVQEIVELLVGVSFNDMTCFNKASFSFVNLDKLKKLLQGGLLLNRFILYVLIFKFCFLKNSKHHC